LRRRFLTKDTFRRLESPLFTTFGQIGALCKISLGIGPFHDGVFPAQVYLASARDSEVYPIFAATHRAMTWRECRSS
jgi:hypothetical protein